MPTFLTEVPPSVLTFAALISTRAINWVTMITASPIATKAKIKLRFFSKKTLAGVALNLVFAWVEIAFSASLKSNPWTCLVAFFTIDPWACGLCGGDANKCSDKSQEGTRLIHNERYLSYARVSSC